MRLLIIDDSLAMRNMLLHYCQEMGATCVTAEDGKAGVEKLESEPAFDAVLVDWDMPRMTGIEFIRHVRAISKWADLKLLVVTAHIGHADVTEALGAGANDYLMKPISLEMLEDKLRILGLVA
jgi:two-component system chemotaxis response regulator CheY